jgi:hypothetical protein
VHKSPPKERFTAAPYDVVTTPLAKVLCSTLKLVKGELKCRDNTHTHSTE